jgi:hypothetical protein
MSIAPQRAVVKVVGRNHNHKCKVKTYNVLDGVQNGRDDDV